MLEGVLKEQQVAEAGQQIGSFNPWYVGGGVKRLCKQIYNNRLIRVSILGMLEGVLKEPALC